MKIVFVLLLAFGSIAAQKIKDGKMIGLDKKCKLGEVCKHRCTKFTETCSDNKNKSEGQTDKSNYVKRRFQGRFKSRKPLKTCGFLKSDSTYSTYEKTDCSFRKAVACKGVLPIHAGVCGNCSEENVCPFVAKSKKMKEAMEKKYKDLVKEIENLKNDFGTATGRKQKRLSKTIERKEKQKQRMEANKEKREEGKEARKERQKVCTEQKDENDQDIVFGNMCEYEKARCAAAAAGQDLPKRKSCKTKCERVTDFCSENNGEEEDDDEEEEDENENENEKTGVEVNDDNDDKRQGKRRGRGGRNNMNKNGGAKGRGSKKEGGRGRWGKKGMGKGARGGNKRIRGGKKTGQLLKMCAMSVEGDFITYNKTKCDVGKAMACDKVKPVHVGECGNCTKENVCPFFDKVQAFKENFAKKFQQKLGGKKLGDKMRKIMAEAEKEEKKIKQICTVDGSQFENMCQFAIARCEAAVEDKELPEKAKCETE